MVSRPTKDILTRWTTTIGALLGGLVAGLAAALAVFSVGNVATVFLTVFVGLVGAFAALAVSDPKSNRVRHLTCALIFSLAIPVTLGISIAAQNDEPVELVVDDSDGGTVIGVGEPAGTTWTQTLNSGTTVTVACRTTVGGATWYRLDSWPTAWLPGSVLRPRAGQEMPDIPRC